MSKKESNDLQLRCDELQRKIDTLERELGVLEGENRILRQSERAQSIASIVSSICKAVIYCAFAACACISVVALAGHTTDAKIIVDIFGKLDISQKLGYAAGIGGVATAVGQRTLSKRQIKKMGQQIKALETKEDPSRSGSLLTESGETNPDDV